jgi:hypothetical protein
MYVVEPVRWRAAGSTPVDTLFDKLATLRLTLLDTSFNTVAVHRDHVAATTSIFAPMTIQKTGEKTRFSVEICMK